MAEVDRPSARRAAPAGATARPRFVIAFLVFVFDQATKWVVTYPLNLAGQPDQTIEITDFFNLKWVENTGVSLGLLSADSDRWDAGCWSR